jgi:WD40 repeat protein
MIAVYCMCKLSEKKFAAAGSGGTIHLFDFFERAGALKGHTGDVNALQKIDAASQLLISASEDKTLRVWDIDNLKVLHVLKGHEDTIDTNMLSFFQSSSEIGTIVSASRDNTVRVWSYSGTQ